MQVLTLRHSLRRVLTRYGELCVSRPVTLALASQRLAWRVIQDVTLAVARIHSLWRVYQISSLFLQKCHFYQNSPTTSMQLVLNMSYNI
jgi:hypothetical protein